MKNKKEFLRKMKKDGKQVQDDKYTTVIRGIFGDMGGDSEIQLILQQDGDVIVKMVDWSKEPTQRQSIEFCTPSMGGGRSPIIHKHLRNMIEELREKHKKGIKDRFEKIADEVENMEKD